MKQESPIQVLEPQALGISALETQVLETKALNTMAPVQSNLLCHKGYHGSIEPSLSDGLLTGRVLLINESIVYAAQTVSDIQQAFEQAVDAYLACCAQQNVPPERPFRGQFNVRVAPALHKSAVLRAQADKTSLNNVVVNALSAYLHGNLHDPAAA